MAESSTDLQALVTTMSHAELQATVDSLMRSLADYAGTDDEAAIRADLAIASAAMFDRWQ